MKHRFQPVDLRAMVLRARDKGDLAARNAAFDGLVRMLQDFAVGVAYARLRDLGTAEDVAQESFVVAWRHLEQLKDCDRFLAWFQRILASQCHRVVRKKSNRLSPITDHAVFDPSNLEEAMQKRERRSLLLEALDQLPATERAAIVLFYFAGRSHAAIAGFLGVTPTTVLKRLFSARKRLKSALAPLRAEISRARPSRSREFAMMVRAGIYNDYVGLYRFEGRPELTVRIERVGNRLVSRSAGQKNTAVAGSRLSELRTKEFDGRARFVRSKSGRVTHFLYYESGRRMGVATKID